jgi:hypothetical protein
VSGVEPGLGTEADPRFQALEADQLEYQGFTATRNRDFSFFPAGAAAHKVLKFPIKLIDAPRRVFTKKWPGAVSGFDKVLKSKDRTQLETRIRMLFEASQADATRRSELLRQISVECRLDEDDTEKLRGVCGLIDAGGLRFDAQKVRRAITGSAPNDCAWYPDNRMIAWLYYEPRMVFERAVHEGRNQGWGTSNQWREPESHNVRPKFVFTTSTNPERGLKAFVLPDEWIVLKAAGTRQQLNYTALDNPFTPPQMGPNNLGGEAEQLFNAMASLGSSSDDFLFYVAALYNSRVAESYLYDGGDSSLRIPLDPAIASSALRLANLGREVRDLRRLQFAIDDRTVLPDALTAIAAEHRCTLGITDVEVSSGRFRSEPQWEIAENTPELIGREIASLLTAIEDIVEEIYEEFNS